MGAGWKWVGAGPECGKNRDFRLISGKNQENPKKNGVFLWKSAFSR
jgi:hypothetical protein